MVERITVEGVAQRPNHTYGYNSKFENFTGNQDL